MKWFLFLLSYMCLISWSCKTGAKVGTSTIKQGITGNVYLVSGNQMPGPGTARPKPKGLQTTVYIFEVTNIKETQRKGNEPLYSAINSKLINTVNTDSTGSFIIELAAGSYSLFVKLTEGYYANLFDGNNNINVVTVETGKLTDTKIMVSHNAFY